MQLPFACLVHSSMFEFEVLPDSFGNCAITSHSPTCGSCRRAISERSTDNSNSNVQLPSLGHQHINTIRQEHEFSVRSMPSVQRALISLSSHARICHARGFVRVWLPEGGRAANSVDLTLAAYNMRAHIKIHNPGKGRGREGEGGRRIHANARTASSRQTHAPRPPPRNKHNVAMQSCFHVMTVPCVLFASLVGDSPAGEPVETAC